MGEMAMSKSCRVERRGGLTYLILEGRPSIVGRRLDGTARPVHGLIN